MNAQSTATAHKVTLIPGDGIGPEITRVVVRILEATGVKFEWDEHLAGAEAYERYQEYIPSELYQSIERNRVALKGPVTTPIGGGFSSINVILRKHFELYANFRPIQNLPGLPTHYPGVDLIIIRENTEGEYVGIEHEVVPGVVESIKIITEKASTRIAEFAFEYARKQHRKKIHSVHKANIMKMSDGLFLKCARNVAKVYPDVIYGEHLVDNTCMQLVTNPYQYDMLQSAVLMLSHIDEADAANRVHRAIEKVYESKQSLTRDVGGTAGTTEFGEAVIAALAS